MSRNHKSKRSFYLDQTFGCEDHFLQSLRQAARAEGVERMQISSYEARILQFLVRVSKAQKVVEIGTLYAYSAMHIAQALPEEGLIWTLDRSSERHKISQKLLEKSKEAKKIRWICGTALESLKSIEGFGPFDMIFIDADKEPYLQYLYWAEKNLKPGGLLTADNSFLFGAVYGETDRTFKEETIKAMKEFNQRLADTSHWQGALIPTEEGLTVSLKQ